RFIDFRPKDADIVEYSRGELTEATTGQVSATAGLSDQLVRTASPETRTTGNSLGVTAGLSVSETYASKLLDALERKTTAILDQGQTFLAELRSLRQIRIAGTYNFDLMLEVPAHLAIAPGDNGAPPSYLISSPAVSKLVADIFLIGVARHVHARGHIGWLRKAPESENDHVFEQVVLDVLPGQPLWEAGVPWLSKVERKSQSCTMTVVANREEAGYVVTRDTEVVATGSGRRAELTFPVASDGKCGTVKVRFLSVVLPPVERIGAVVLR